jgi:hypothetical protein
MTFRSIRRSLPLLTAAACALACSTGAQARRAGVEPGTAAAARGLQSPTPSPKADATATLEQCLTALVASERTATFVGEMVAIPGTARMQISIGLLERDTGENQYRAVSAPGLGGWRGSAPGVKNYTYIKQVTNLAAPAFYRGAVRFRWLNGKGHVIKAEELRTPRCEQPAPPPASSEAPSTTTTGTASAAASSPETDQPATAR